MKFKVILIFLVFAAILSFKIYSPQTFGIEEITLKEAYLDGKFPEYGTSAWTYDSVPHLPSFKRQMTHLIGVPESNKVIGLGKGGGVLLYDFDKPDEKPDVVLDITSKIMGIGDGGLLGSAFHPQFNDSTSEHFREVYLYYTYKYGGDLPLYNRLSKYKFTHNLDSIIPSSEEIIIQQFDRDWWHNGGDMFFDKEGYLYLALGDEGKSNDYFENSQKINDAIFGGIIRIDVDMDSTRSHPIRRFPKPSPEKPDGYPDNINQNYMIPNDNPWVNEDGDYLEEFFAIGLRSPHRIFYDSLTEKIWVGDVGQAAREEINIISKGSNGQWAYKEGSIDGFREKPDVILGTETPPIYDYGRDLGKCIIGGMVYRGDKYPDLIGKYVFGDYASGNVWALDPENNNEVTLLCTVKARPNFGLVSFFQSSDGYIYILLFDGTFYKLNKREVTDPPKLLSQTGVFSDLENMIPSEGIVPYGVNTPLWSDGAHKKRWVALPKGSEGINFKERGIWDFPSGSVFIKHFEFPITEDSTIKLETRFFVIDENKEGYGVTYKWNNEGTDAELIEEGVLESVDFSYMENEILKEQTWSFPSRSQCLECHNKNAGFVLGVKTSQINMDYLYMDSGISNNQISTWNHLGFFSDSLTLNLDNLPKLISLGDTTASLENRVRSYLDANCSYCHMPGGVEAAFDARESTPVHQQGLVNRDIIGRNSITGNKIISPQNLQNSELWLRDNSLEENQMPPLGKNELDTTYLKVLEHWIESLKPIVIQEDVILCKGESYTFPDSVTISAIDSSFSYTSNFVSQIGLDSIIETSISINEIDTTLLLEGSTIISNQDNANYQWYDFTDDTIKIEGATEQQFKPENNGKYGVIISFENCMDTSEVKHIITSGILVNEIDNSIKVFPNPTPGIVCLSFEKEISGGMVNVLDITGKVIYSEELSNKLEVFINLENQASGIYFFNVVDERHKKAVIKILKE